MKLIGFKVLVLDSNDQIIEDLGSVTMPILSWTSNLTPRTIRAENSDNSYFVANTPDYEYIGNGIPNYVYNDISIYGESAKEKVRQNIFQYAPLTTIVKTEDYSGYKIRLLNTASGYYAENTIGSQGQLSNTYTNLYDNNGTLLGTTEVYGLPFRSSYLIGVLLAHDMVDDVMTGGTISELKIEPYYPASDTGIYYVRLSVVSATSKSQAFINWVNALQPEPEPPEPSDDPYSSTGGPSGPGGGPAPTGGTGTTGNGGLHDDTSDAIPTPSTPSDVAISGGLFTAYNPTASQLASFAGALWNMQVSDINDVLRFLFGGDAFNAVIGLHLLPVAPSTGGSPNIKLGNWDTGVPAPKITSQYKQVPFGSVLLPEYWGNCIDYAPYTKIQLALPYIGIVDVDTDDVLGSTNTLTYNIDVLSGAICATLKCEKFNLNSVIYQWSGACAVSLPFSGASYNSVLSAIAGIAAAGMGFAAMAAGPIGAALPAAALAAGGGAFGAGSAASIMGTMKGKVQKSGSFGANSGALGIMTPYFILTRPVQSVPETWQADKGYPSNISAQLGTVTGYTEVSEINLECSGTEAEKNEIIDLLKKGVLF